MTEHPAGPAGRTGLTAPPGLTAVLGLTALVGACGERPGEPPPSVILISIDTLRPDHLGCYGHGRDTSPAIDALAAEGLVFADVSSSAPWTLPAHATMLTGLYPSHHGVKSEVHRLPTSTVTLAEELVRAGYQTLAVVNSFYVAGPAFQLRQGFERFEWIPENETDPATSRRRIVNRGPQIVARARELLEARRKDRPFFLFLHFYDVHTDFTPDAAHRKRFVRPYSGALDGSTAQLVELRRGREQPSEADLAFLREMYDAEIRQLDDVLAGFFDHLRESGLFQDTLIVVTSDHGEEFGEHQGLLHGRTQYQELLAVPLVLRGPGVPAGRVISRPVGLVDLVPTILGVLDLERRGRTDGVDLSAGWDDPPGAAEERVLFGEADHGNRLDGRPVSDVRHMVRIGQDKLLLDRVTRRAELYHLGSDPGERRDRSSAEPRRAHRLMTELRRFMRSEVRPELVRAPTGEDRETLKAAGYVGGDD